MPKSDAAKKTNKKPDIKFVRELLDLSKRAGKEGNEDARKILLGIVYEELVNPGKGIEDVTHRKRGPLLKGEPEKKAVPVPVPAQLAVFEKFFAVPQKKAGRKGKKQLK